MVKPEVKGNTFWDSCGYKHVIVSMIGKNKFCLIEGEDNISRYQKWVDEIQNS